MILVDQFHENDQVRWAQFPALDPDFAEPRYFSAHAIGPRVGSASAARWCVVRIARLIACNVPAVSLDRKAEVLTVWQVHRNAGGPLPRVRSRKGVAFSRRTGPFC
jgi:hypothetical protein